MTDESKPGFWAILELMGHKQLAGHVTEEQVAGAQMLKVEVPEIVNGDEPERARPSFVRYYSPSALYSLTPCSEEHARQVVEWYRPDPLPVYLPPAPQLIHAGVVREAEIDEPYTDEEMRDGLEPGEITREMPF